MGRHAVGGRNWEGFGPDPYLAGVAMNASITGIQSVGVQACSKHYVGNEQETQRTSTVAEDGTVTQAISSNIDDRTLHELYTWPFANAVKAGTASIMCSYNRLNGIYACENSDTLSIILKEELNFRGYVVSDWFATHSTANSSVGGLDMEMPGPVGMENGNSFFGDKLLDAIKKGYVPEHRLNDMAMRVMTPYFLLGQDKNYPTIDPATGPAYLASQFGHDPNSPFSGLLPEVDARDVRGDHAQLIREIGAAGTVLLKNTKGTLPLANGRISIGIFGNDAPLPEVGSAILRDYTAHQGFGIGTQDVGAGSGSARHTSLVSPMDAIATKVNGMGGRVQYIFDHGLLAAGITNSIYPTPQVCLVFLKSYASESFDRPSLDLQSNATRVVEQVAGMCTSTIVITHSPDVILMPWVDNENVTAILAAHYPGEQSGNSIADILWGETEPSGRLPYTIPKDASSYGPPVVNLTQPATNPLDWKADFSEGLMIDYRHFDENEIEPLYEFGYGMGFTTFDLSRTPHVKVENRVHAHANLSKGSAPGGMLDLWNTVAVVTTTVTNTGTRAGRAVPQLYVSFPAATTPAGSPPKVLRGFKKVLIKKGRMAEVQFQLTRRDMSYWDIDKKKWVIPKGEFKISLGFSSRDLRNEIKVQILS